MKIVLSKTTLLFSVLAVTIAAADAGAQTVKLNPVPVDAKGVESGADPMITPSATFLYSAEEAGVDPELFQLDGEPFVTSVTVENQELWVGVTTRSNGTKQYSITGKNLETVVKDGPPTTWSRTYTAFSIPLADNASMPLHVRATGNPASALRYFIPLYNQGQWTPEGCPPLNVAMLQDNGEARLLIDLDGDNSYRFQNPTMEVREMGKPFKLQGRAYRAQPGPDGTSLSFATVDAPDAPELAVLRFGSPAPDWSAKSFDGKPVKLSDFRGKFVFFDVWATWCGPCLGEIPHIQKAQEEFGDKVYIIGVSIDGDMELPKKMAADKKLTYKQVWAPDEFKSEICQQYQVNGIPSTFLVDPDGKLITSGLRGESIAKAMEMASTYETAEAKQYFTETTERAEALGKVQALVEAGKKDEAIQILKSLQQKHKDPDGLKSLANYLEYLQNN